MKLLSVKIHALSNCPFASEELCILIHVGKGEFEVVEQNKIQKNFHFPTEFQWNVLGLLVSPIKLNFQKNKGFNLK